MCAFASNSVLCRLALRSSAIDPASFTGIRLAAGAGMLVLVTALKGTFAKPRVEHHGWNAVMLFVYAIAFSFAYVNLSVGTGALIAFGAVQATMLVIAIVSGERPGALTWIGLLVALGGLVYLVLPRLDAPSPLGALLMTSAGMAWGVYSILGKQSRSALQSTTHSFLLALPLALVAWLLLRSNAHLTTIGVTLAVVSGAVTSGLGYVLWYAALRGMTSTSAALVQLTVPVLAALAGVVLLSETFQIRLLLAAILVLGGVALALVGGRRRNP